jgi:hypothetical protein
MYIGLRLAKNNFYRAVSPLGLWADKTYQVRVGPKGRVGPS